MLGVEASWRRGSSAHGCVRCPIYRVDGVDDGVALVEVMQALSNPDHPAAGLLFVEGTKRESKGSRRH